MSVIARIALAVMLVPVAAFAQDQRLAARLDKPTQVAINGILDSARAAKLPTAPLVNKALEGSAKGSDGVFIALAVHQLFARMRSASSVLGPKAAPDEIKAAADALDAGASLHDLERIRSASGKRSVIVPLAVLSDLIGRKVPVATATTVVLQLQKSGVKDTDLSLFQRSVRSDIDRGADPTAAATTRARGLMARGSQANPAK